MCLSKVLIPFTEMKCVCPQNYDKQTGCCAYAARLFGPKNPSAPFSTERNFCWRPMQELKALQTNADVLLKPSFASSTVTRSAPAANSKGLWANTLRSGQHFFKQRGCSVQRLPSQSVVWPARTSISTPAAASALHKLGKPFNFIMGHSAGDTGFRQAA